MRTFCAMVGDVIAWQGNSLEGFIPSKTFREAAVRFRFGGKRGRSATVQIHGNEN